MGQDTMRDAVLTNALEMFVLHGFEGTSIAHIAERSGCSKATVLYHFGSKQSLLEQTLEPLVADFEGLLDLRARALTDETQTPDGLRARALTDETQTPDGVDDVAVLRRSLGVLLRHRNALSLLLNQGEALAASSVAVRRLAQLGQNYRSFYARPGDDLEARVRAVWAITGLLEVAREFENEDPDRLRTVLESVMAQLLRLDAGAENAASG